MVLGLGKRSLLSFLADTRGGVMALSAFLLTGLIGFASLVAEFGAGLERQTENQRIADVAAYSAATYYGANTGASNAMTTATLVAQNVAAMNGVASNYVSVSLENSPVDASKNAIKVSIATPQTFGLGALLGAAKSLNVKAESYAQIGGSPTTACITALNAAGGITLSGGTAISAPNCGVASNASVTVPCGTTIRAKSLTYGTSLSQGCSGVTAGTIKQASVTDPLASTSGVSAAESHVASISTLTSPSAPSVPTGTISFNLGWYPTTTQTSGSCSASNSGSTWTINCPAGGTYNFSGITLAGGMSLNFNPAGSASSTYTFSSNFNSTGTVTFGPGNYVFAKGLTISGGSVASFTSGGSFSFGPNSTSCNGQNYSICNTSSLTFAAGSSFQISNGVYVSGGSKTVMGSGSNNSFQIGAAGDGNAFWVGGGATLTLGDATGSNSVFQVAGVIDAASGGGSCMTLPAASQHNIKGSFKSAGGTILGAGTYSINGYIAFGQNGGGSVTCNGSTVGLSGTNVTLVYNAASAAVGGVCDKAGLCFAAGFNYVTLSAPSSGTMSGLLFVGPQSGSASAVFTGGSGAAMSGAIYVPRADFNMSGGASIATIPGGCLQIVASTIALSGGTTAASACVSDASGGGGSGKAQVVQ
ncbi:hypothetical protein M2323_003324 [Rhodoblastus acidophilus]|uniref:hypothetical protein n=1 Tax=Rhodoblastus acidophilus TaxID=1074 RepID=UPI0022259FCD|nr:hypothetical protein [Rhodoblastus acidophilus]MCW2285369.1 hypothetical protein [Rhodoblastus acidophilus]MCW2334383.1 hypothetical protein [Rhodoblastus acidophilus]